MPTVTVSVPEDLKKRMNAQPGINWSAIARRAFERRVQDEKILEEISKQSTMTEKDAIELGRELKRNARKYYE